jgi:hypothetical protein
MPSFHKVKIVKNLNKKYKFKIKKTVETHETVLSKNNEKIVKIEDIPINNKSILETDDIAINDKSIIKTADIEIKDETILESVDIEDKDETIVKTSNNISFSIHKKSNSIKKSNSNVSLVNKDNNDSEIESDIDEDEVYGNHYIGILFINSISINKLHKMDWHRRPTKDTLYLNSTDLYIKKQIYYPIFELDNDLFNCNFKYKKYIRSLIFDKYNINKKDIINIKLYNTFGRLHNYLVILNGKILSNGLSSSHVPLISDKYSWRSRLDFFNLDNTINNPTQNQIYNFILDCDKIKLGNTFKLLANMDENCPEYISKNKIIYLNVIKTLSKIDFGY